MVSLESKRSDLIDLYKLFSDFKDFEFPDDTKKRKNEVMNNTHQLYNKYLNTYKKEYDCGDLNKEDKKKIDPNLYKILGKKKQKSGIKQPTQLKQLNPNEISKSLWIEVPRNDFISFIKDVVDNLDNKDYQTTVDGLKYDLKKGRKVFAGNNYQNISKNEPLELYDSLMKPDVDALRNATNRCKNKRKNILNVLDNIESSVFDGTYFHHKAQSLESEESIAKRTKLRRQKFDEIAEKEKNKSNELFKKYFTNYQSPSDIYKRLNKSKDEMNVARVDSISEILGKLERIIKSVPTDDAAKVEEN